MKFSVNFKHVLLLHIVRLLRPAFKIVITQDLCVPGRSWWPFGDHKIFLQTFWRAHVSKFLLQCHPLPCPGSPFPVAMPGGKWDESMVFKYLTEQEVDGKKVVVSRIKSGKSMIKLVLNHILTEQSLSWKVLDQRRFVVGTPRAGLSSFLEKNKMDLQSTDRLTQLRYQGKRTTSFVGEKGTFS